MRADRVDASAAGADDVVDDLDRRSRISGSQR